MSESKRNPVLAILFSLFFPGMGQCYAGQGGVAVVFFVLPFLAPPVLMVAVLLLPEVYWLGLYASPLLVAGTVGIVSAILAGVKVYAQTDFKPRWYNRTWLYVVAPVVYLVLFCSSVGGARSLRCEWEIFRAINVQSPHAMTFMG